MSRKIIIDNITKFKQLEGKTLFTSSVIFKDLRISDSCRFKLYVDTLGIINVNKDFLHRYGKNVRSAKRLLVASNIDQIPRFGQTKIYLPHYLSHFKEDNDNVVVVDNYLLRDMIEFE